MNDREFELRLHDELPRLLAAPDAPASLLAYVRRLGLDEPAAVERHRLGNRRSAAGRPDGTYASQGRMYKSTRVLLSLAAAIAVIAILVGSLAWRSSHQSAAAASLSSSGSSASASAPLIGATPTPFAQPSPAGWTGPAAEIYGMGRIGTNSGWAMVSSGASLKLYLTGDGGQSWEDRTPADLVAAQEPATTQTKPRGPQQISFADENHGWFLFEHDLGGGATSHTLYTTVDGGRTWSESVLPALGSAWPRWIARVDDDHFLIGFLDYATSIDQIWSTADGGSTWSHVDETGAGSPEDQAQFSTPLDGWGFTMAPGVAVTHTVDGGKTWKSTTLPYAYGNSFGGGGLETPVLVDGKLVVTAEIATGTSSAGLDKLSVVTWASTDGGAHWTKEHEVQLGDMLWLNGPHAPGLSAYMPRYGASITIVDAIAGRVVATMDTSSVCPVAGGAAQVDSASVTSAGEVWTSCVHSLYGTSDGGKTWRPLMGTP
jgi:photosystem II stability/assembly factor-like uncharacterized protein